MLICHCTMAGTYACRTCPNYIREFGPYQNIFGAIDMEEYNKFLKEGYMGYHSNDYEVMYHCENCGYSFMKSFEKGSEASPGGVVCPKCGCPKGIKSQTWGSMGEGIMPGKKILKG